MTTKAHQLCAVLLLSCLVVLASCSADRDPSALILDVVVGPLGSAALTSAQATYIRDPRGVACADSDCSELIYVSQKATVGAVDLRLLTTRFVKPESTAFKAINGVAVDIGASLVYFGVNDAIWRVAVSGGTVSQITRPVSTVFVEAPGLVWGKVGAVPRLFASDSNRKRVYNIDLTQAAGMDPTTVKYGVDGAYSDGPAATKATFGAPRGMALTTAGDALLLADSGFNCVRRLNVASTTPEVATHAGEPTNLNPLQTGSLLSAGFVGVMAVALRDASSADRFFVALPDTVALVDKAAGTVVVLIASGEFSPLSFARLGNAAHMARLHAVSSLAFSPVRNELFIADSGSHMVTRLRGIDSDVQSSANGDSPLLVAASPGKRYELLEPGELMTWSAAVGYCQSRTYEDKSTGVSIAIPGRLAAPTSTDEYDTLVEMLVATGTLRTWVGVAASGSTDGLFRWHFGPIWQPAAALDTIADPGANASRFGPHPCVAADDPLGMICAARLASATPNGAATQLQIDTRSETFVATTATALTQQVLCEYPLLTMRRFGRTFTIMSDEVAAEDAEQLCTDRPPPPEEAAQAVTFSWQMPVLETDEDHRAFVKFAMLTGPLRASDAKWPRVLIGLTDETAPGSSFRWQARSTAVFNAVTSTCLVDSCRWGASQPLLDTVIVTLPSATEGSGSVSMPKRLWLQSRARIRIRRSTAGRSCISFRRVPTLRSPTARQFRPARSSVQHGRRRGSPRLTRIAKRVSSTTWFPPTTWSASGSPT
jgi:hypothetical protein